MGLLSIVIGLGLAILGARLLISGGVSIAQRFNIPDLVIGSTIIAMGTSMPEVSVNVQSALAGSTDLALGNIIGSNIFNICMIIGVVALVTPLAIPVNAASKDFPMCLIAAIVVGVAGNELYFDGIQYHEIMPSHGIISSDREMGALATHRLHLSFDRSFELSQSFSKLHLTLGAGAIRITYVDARLLSGVWALDGNACVLWAL